MLFLIWLVLCCVVVFLLALPPTIWRREIFRRYSGSRLVACPENQQPATVSIDVRHAAATGMHGRRPDLRLCECTRWPERTTCGQGCLAQAAREEPDAADAKARRKAIYHLPIVLAAFVAWYVGAIWHAQYAFRPRWLHAVGLTHAQAKALWWWYPAHVLTAGICLLFAYGVAWLLVAWHRKGVLPGVLMSVLLGGALVAASWRGIAALPHDLLVIEAGYVVLATLIVGTIVGGLYDRLVLRAP